MKRREFLAAATMAAFAPQLMAQQKTLVEVWRSPTCGCCGAWVKHLERNGFSVKVHMVEDTSPVRRAAGIPDRLGSCHTAKVDSFAIEGHVPASDIRRLLAEQPKAIGLTAPGMPPGSPGMDIPNSPSFEVLLVGMDGKPSVFSRHTPR